MSSKDLSASDFMARTSELLKRSSAEGAQVPVPAPPAGGSFAQRTDDLLARTAALLGKPIPATPMPTSVPVAESVMSVPEYTPPPAADGSFAQRSTDLLARTAQLLGKPITPDPQVVSDVPQYAFPSPPPYHPPPQSFTPPPPSAPAAEGSFAQRSAELLARTAQLLGKAPAADAGFAPPAVMAAPPIMSTPPAAPLQGGFNQRADDLLARTAHLLGHAPQTPAIFEHSSPAPMPVSLPPSVESAVAAHSSGSLGGAGGSFAERSNDLLARTAQLLGRNPCANGAPTAAPLIPPPTSYEPQHPISTPFAMAEMPAPPTPPEGGTSFAQRSADVLARTAQLLNKAQNPAPKLELLDMLRQAPPIGGTKA